MGMGMEMSSKMSRRSHLLLFALFCGLCHSQYDDYGPPPDNPGGESGPGSGDVFGSGDSSSAKAYYTYRTASCRFDCNANEYWWWSTAAMTGLLKNRSEVKNEFKYYLPEVFKAKDPKMYALITDTTKGYKLPTRPPNGKYTGKRTCVSGPNVI